MAEAETARLIAELWYDEVPDLTDPRLLEALQEVSPQVELQDGSITVPHSAVTMELEDGTVPLLTAVLTGSGLDREDKSLPDVSQTWDWAEVGDAMDRCTANVLVTELLASVFTPQQRVTGLMSVVRVLVEQTRPTAIFWPNSQRVTNPLTFDPDGLDGVINVRFFSVGLDDGAKLMDTVGLDLFELPDLQCHYRDANPADVATMLFNTAVYVFGEGDVIDDGHTISGLQGDEHFVVRHEDAMVGPSRTVLDVDLGDPYAAGTRVRE